MPDVRWKQRFSNYINAYKLLGEAVKMKQPSELETEGLIQRFEYTFELGWKTLKDYLEEKGFAEIVGSKDAIRLAYTNGIISHGEVWMEMINDRNLTSHLYDSNVVKQIAGNVVNKYYPAFTELYEFLKDKL
ncbi:MAG: nucleotidyltransferase [Candidatus Cloacimonetes bacterium HGW-Cloacimonetes-3]|jgi:nucleotidyltransferase substrate binding protein (TIGR01987 family)|nr:MAG: nucleotidyltransferase [Candidatus Cloacimonetes bacterium HGW-Cloacimonetes-3]